MFNYSLQVVIWLFPVYIVKVIVTLVKDGRRDYSRWVYFNRKMNYRNGVLQLGREVGFNPKGTLSKQGFIAK